MMRRLLPLLPLLLGACGYTDAGGGTNTLTVVARSTFHLGAEDRSSVSVRLSKDGRPVAATVAVKDGDTGDLFTLTDATTSSSETVYRGTLPGYHRRLELGIKGSADELDVKLEGPGPHTIVRPVPGAIIGSGDMLAVEWATRDGVAADEVELALPDTQVLPRVLTSDTGSSHDIPLALLAPGSYTLQVTRLNRVEPAGAVTGSSFTISYGVQTLFSVR